MILSMGFHTETRKHDFSRAPELSSHVGRNIFMTKFLEVFMRAKSSSYCLKADWRVDCCNSAEIQYLFTKIIVIPGINTLQLRKIPIYIDPRSRLHFPTNSTSQMPGCKRFCPLGMWRKWPFQDLCRIWSYEIHFWGAVESSRRCNM